MEAQTKFIIRSPSGQQTVTSDTHRTAVKESGLGDAGDRVQVDGQGEVVRYLVTAHGHYRRQATYRYRGIASEDES